MVLIRSLVSGDVSGQFDKLFSRINAVQKKTGKFDILFCVGDFFGADNSQWEKFQNGSEQVPIATFILGPNDTANESYFTDPNGCELCENVTYLGRKGVYTGSSGLSVVYVSGVESSAESMTSFSASDVTGVRRAVVEAAGFRGVDLLLTSPWPRGADKYASQAEGVDGMKTGSSALAQLALSLKPRYHFAAKEGVHYERQPYRNHRVLQSAAEHCTRFIALAKVNNPNKKKFLYAFTLVPMRHMDTAELTKQPSDCTECPFKYDSTALQTDQDKEKGAQFFYDEKAVEGKKGQKRHKDNRDGPPHKKPPQPKGPCWFCLGSPEVEKHLVVSVGTHVYMALAKGGLNEEHVLILPIGHYQSTCSAPKEVKDELEKYKGALRKCMKAKGKVVVFFERNYRTQHLQIQAVSVRAGLREEVKETFQGCALSQNLELHEIPKHSDLAQIVPAGAPYFYAELPSGEKLLHRISKNFPLQFGREALAHESLLDLAARVDWRDCKHSKDEETTMATAFRDAFETYDFTLED